MYRLQVVGSTAIVQPVRHTQAVGDSLVVDLRKGSLGTATYPLMHSDYITLLAILGVYRLRNRTVVAAVTAAQQVATIGASAVFVVKGTQLFGPADADTDTDDAKLTELLQGALDPAGTGANLYFSYDRNLTNRRQREASLRAASAGPPSHQQSDARFFWNHFLSQPLIDAGAHQFVMPVVQGFVEQLEIAGPPGGSGRSRKAVVTLLARRDVGRVGTRHWRRGADREGHVANFVETEQLVEFDDGSAASFVQTRGSIPILWSQVPNIKYKPPTLISDAAKYRPAFFKHAKAMTEAYTGLVGVNLVNTHGSEAKLAAAYEQEVAHAKATLSDVELVGFDFHKECGAANYANLSKLWQQLEPHFQRFGFFMQEGEEVVLRQSGVFRVNCVDCLDRTNVVQGLLARKALEALLRRVGFMQPHDDLPSAFPETEAGFKNLWADHGDAVSLHYAGTGALKSGFTRTGKRSVDGLIDDGIKSCLRYYLNNFEDGTKQDSLDLLMGGYQVSASKSSPFQDKQPSCVLLLLVALLCALLGVAQLWRAAVQASTFSALMALPLWLAAVQVINTVVRQGPRFTCRPQLRPDLTQPW